MGRYVNTATAAVQIDVKQIILVKLHLSPSASVGDDPEGMQNYRNCVQKHPKLARVLSVK